MSWDVSIQKFSAKYRSVSEIPADAEMLDLGSRAAVHSAISGVFPGVDWSDPTWGTFDSEFGSIEFNNGGEEPLKGFMMHVRASPEVVPMIVALCRQQDWSAIDCSTGEMLEQSSEPERGINEWRAYRDQVVGNDDPD